MLSICARVDKPTEQKVTREVLSGVISGRQVPIYAQEADDRTVRAWADVGVNDLLSILGPKTLLRLMISPTGVFGFYDSAVPFNVRGERIFAITPEGETEVPYISYEGEAQEIMNHWRDRTATSFYIAKGETYYFRSIGGVDALPRIAESMSPAMPNDFKTLAETNLYISQKGSVTNLHCDYLSGAIHQVKGSKRVLIFPRDESPKLALNEPPHLLKRRSQYAGRLTQEVVDANPVLASARGYEVILKAGQWVYIPRRWAHYVETLENDTVSLIVNFRV